MPPPLERRPDTARDFGTVHYPERNRSNHLLAVRAECQQALQTVVSNPELSIHEQTQIFCDVALTSVEHIQESLISLTEALLQGGREGSLARQIFSDIVSTRIPNFLRRMGIFQSLNRAYIAAGIVPFFYTHQNIEPPPGTIKLVNEITWSADSETRMAALMAVSSKTTVTTAERLFFQSALAKRPRGTSPIESYVDRADKELLQTATLLIDASEKGEFTPRNLRLASLGIGLNHEDITGNEKPSVIVDILRETAMTFIKHFVDHHAGSQDGYRAGVASIVQALTDKRASYASIEAISSLLTHKPQVTLKMRGIEHDISLEPILKGFLAPFSTAAENEEDRQLLSALVQATTLYFTIPDGGQYTTNPLIGGIVLQNRLPVPQQLLLMHQYASDFLSSFEIIYPLSNEELFDVFSLKKNITLSRDEEGIIRATIYDIGMPIETGRVVGYKKNQNNDEVAGLEESFSREKNPFAPDIATVDGAMVDILIRHFGQAWFSDEKIEQMENNRQRLWKDIEGPNAIRGTSFTPSRSRQQLGGRMATDKAFPRVEFYHQDEVWDKGVYLSDIVGKLVLAEDLTIDFSLDKNGYLHGDIDQLANTDVLPFGVYVALNEQLVRLAHNALVFDQNDVSEKAYKAAIRHLGGSVKTGAQISQARVEQQLMESQQYVKDEAAVETRLPNGTIIYLVPIDRQKMYVELQKDPHKNYVHATVMVQLGNQQESLDEEAKRKWKERGGYRVLLPYKYHPSPNAITKAQILKQALVVHYVVERDNHGLTHELEFYTTIRLRKKPKEQIEARMVKERQAA